MRLTMYTDYALRLLIFLALKTEGRATIAEIAESYAISKNHLMKVAHQLGVAGYLENVRGKHGGLRLAKPAAEINLGEIVRRTEPDMALVPCFKPIDALCAIRQACPLRHALEKAVLAFFEVLDSYTLADLARPRGPMRAMLAIASVDEFPAMRNGSRSSQTKAPK